MYLKETNLNNCKKYYTSIINKTILLNRVEYMVVIVIQTLNFAYL